MQPPRKTTGLWTVVANPGCLLQDDGVMIFQSNSVVITFRKWTQRDPTCHEAWSTKELGPQGAKIWDLAAALPLQPLTVAARPYVYSVGLKLRMPIWKRAGPIKLPSEQKSRKRPLPLQRFAQSEVQPRATKNIEIYRKQKKRVKTVTFGHKLRMHKALLCVFARVYAPMV